MLGGTERKEPKIRNNTHRSKTDPDARLLRKSSGAATGLHYSATYIMDSKSRIIVDSDIGMPDKRADCNNALKQLRRARWRHGDKAENYRSGQRVFSGKIYTQSFN